MNSSMHQLELEGLTRGMLSRLLKVVGPLVLIGFIILGTSGAEATSPGAWTTASTPVNGPGVPVTLPDGVQVVGPQLPTVLPNGLVLASVTTAAGTYAELFDPTHNSWRLTGVPPFAPGWLLYGGVSWPVFAPSSMRVLANGKVLALRAVTSDAAELYDPLTTTWKRTGDPVFAPDGWTLTWLPDGTIFGLRGTNAELYNPATGLWSTTTSSPFPPDVSATPVLLANGKVLASGGCCHAVDAGYNGTFYAAESSAALYDPATRAWTPTGSMHDGRLGHTATLLADGNVLVTGGLDGFGRFPAPVQSSELYDPVTGVWTSTGAFGSVFPGATATLLSDGEVLAIDENVADVGPYKPAIAVYDPRTAAWTPTAPADLGVGLGVAAVSLPNGTALISGDPPRLYSPRFSPLPTSCFLSGVGTDTNGHAFIKIAARDIVGGLKSLRIVQAGNAVATVSEFAPGSRDPAIVSATGRDATQPSRVTVQVTSQTGQTISCGSIVAELMRRHASPVREVFADVPRAESQISVTNADPGFVEVTLNVNGRRFHLQHLRAKQQTTVNVSSAMHEGANNIIVVTAHGAPNTSALIVIGD